jgi:hypothetical protein
MEEVTDKPEEEISNLLASKIRTRYRVDPEKSEA